MNNLKWFHLDNYEKVQELTLSQLVTELKLRQWILGTELPYGHVEPESIIWGREGLTRFWANKIIAGKPFASAYENDFYFSHLPFTSNGFDYNPSPLTKNFDAPGIAAITGKDINLLISNCRPIEKKILNIQGESALERFYAQPVRPSKSTVIAEIDLSKPINQLKVEFEKFVKDGKKSLNISTKPSNKWKREKIRNIFMRHTLPILDLKIFSKHTNINITIDDLCDLIYGDFSADKLSTFHTNDFPTAMKVIQPLEIKTLESMINIGESLTSKPLNKY